MAINKVNEKYLIEARKKYLEAQISTLWEIQRIYVRASKKVEKVLNNAPPSRTAGRLGTSTRGKSQKWKTSLDDLIVTLNNESIVTIQNGIAASVKYGISGPKQIAIDLLSKSFEIKDIDALFAQTNKKALLAVMAKTQNDGLELSDRIWKVGKNYRKAIDILVEDGMALGLDSRKLAKEVQKYLQPGVWTPQKQETRKRVRIPKDVSYEAMRLARTEMNNAFHTSAIHANLNLPSYQGSYWRLSGAHPLVDICDQYAHHNGDGFFEKGTEPSKPHPQCLCFMIAKHEDARYFAERINHWMKNPKSAPDIERWYQDIGSKFMPKRK